MENEEKITENELTKSNQSADENSSQNLFDDDDDTDELDWNDEFVTRDEYLDALDEISTHLYLHQVYLEELQRRVEDTPQRLTCNTNPENPTKTCVVHYNLGLSPIYAITFRKGHNSSSQATLCIYVQRPEAEKKLQYKGIILGLPKYLTPGTSVILRSHKSENAIMSFEFLGAIDINPDVLSILQSQQQRICDLERQVRKLIRLGQKNAPER